MRKEKKQTWHDTAALQRVPDEGAQLLVGDLDRAQVLDQLGEPDKNLLVGETVKGTGKTVERGGE